MKHLDLFAGIGGFALASKWMGWQTIGFVEKDEFCQKRLRKNFGNDIFLHDDITTFSGESFRGNCDIVTGGFPCQPFSFAGEQKGLSDERHLFPHMLRVIREVGPAWIVAENVRGLLSVESGETFEEICSSLEREGYAVQPFIIPACAVNAPHRRDRIWIIAHSNGERARRQSKNLRNEKSQSCKSDSNANSFEISDGVGRRGRRYGDSRRMRRSLQTARSDSALSFDDSDTLGNGKINGRQGRKVRHENGNGQTEKFGRLDIESRIISHDSGVIAGSKIAGLEGCGIVNGSSARADSTRRRSRCAETRQQSIGWDESWLEVAAEFCTLDDGLPEGLDESERADIYKAVKYFGREQVEQKIGCDLREVESRVYRTESLKSAGNAIVPELAFEIFKAIEQSENF